MMFVFRNGNTPVSEERKREFIQTYQIQKNITAPTLRYKAKRLLEIPDEDFSLKFDHLEFFRTMDGTLVGITSPYSSRDPQTLNDLERLGWTRCEGLYTTTEDSFVKTVPPGTQVGDVLHRRLAEIVARNFETDASSFVAEHDLATWYYSIDGIHERNRTWKKVLGVESFDKFKVLLDQHFGHFRTRKSVEMELYGTYSSSGRERCWMGWKFKSAVPVFDETSSILAHI